MTLQPRMHIVLSISRAPIGVMISSSSAAVYFLHYVFHRVGISVISVLVPSHKHKRWSICNLGSIYNLGSLFTMEVSVFDRIRCSYPKNQYGERRGPHSRNLFHTIQECTLPGKSSKLLCQPNHQAPAWLVLSIWLMTFYFNSIL